MAEAARKRLLTRLSAWLADPWVHLGRYWAAIAGADLNDPLSCILLDSRLVAGGGSAKLHSAGRLTDWRG